MANANPYKRYIRARKKLRRKLTDVERKLDHLIVQLPKEDPRAYSENNDSDALTPT